MLVRRDDLDINGHVNNSKYLGWLLECLRGRPAKASSRPCSTSHSAPNASRRCAHFTMRPPRPNETDATAAEFPQAPHGLLHVIRRTDSGDDVCRAVTRWTQKVRLPA